MICENKMNVHDHIFESSTLNHIVLNNDYPSRTDNFMSDGEGYRSDPTANNPRQYPTHPRNDSTIKKMRIDNRSLNAINESLVDMNNFSPFNQLNDTKYSSNNEGRHANLSNTMTDNNNNTNGGDMVMEGHKEMKIEGLGKINSNSNSLMANDLSPSHLFELSQVDSFSDFSEKNGMDFPQTELNSSMNDSGDLFYDASTFMNDNREYAEGHFYTSNSNSSPQPNNIIDDQVFQPYPPKGGNECFGDETKKDRSDTLVPSNCQIESMVSDRSMSNNDSNINNNETNVIFSNGSIGFDGRSIFDTSSYDDSSKNYSIDENGLRYEMRNLQVNPPNESDMRGNPLSPSMIDVQFSFNNNGISTNDKQRQNEQQEQNQGSSSMLSFENRQVKTIPKVQSSQCIFNSDRFKNNTNNATNTTTNNNNNNNYNNEMLNVSPSSSDQLSINTPLSANAIRSADNNNQNQFFFHNNFNPNSRNSIAVASNIHVNHTMDRKNQLMTNTTNNAINHNQDSNEILSERIRRYDKKSYQENYDPAYLSFSPPSDFHDNVESNSHNQLHHCTTTSQNHHNLLQHQQQLSQKNTSKPKRTQTHNAIEKKYRDSINECITNLRKIVNGKCYKNFCKQNLSDSMNRSNVSTNSLTNTMNRQDSNDGRTQPKAVILRTAVNYIHFLEKEIMSRDREMNDLLKGRHLNNYPDQTSDNNRRRIPLKRNWEKCVNGPYQHSNNSSNNNNNSNNNNHHHINNNLMSVNSSSIKSDNNNHNNNNNNNIYNNNLMLKNSNQLNHTNINNNNNNNRNSLIENKSMNDLPMLKQAVSSVTKQYKIKSEKIIDGGSSDIEITRYRVKPIIGQLHKHNDIENSTSTMKITTEVTDPENF
ncbi:hypothetical protein SNEBB_006934 [Seison nebaliae]|nr:hypothetical protein SNEBB_006934 [Seison nebaliae]